MELTGKICRDEEGFQLTDSEKAGILPWRRRWQERLMAACHGLGQRRVKALPGCDAAGIEHAGAGQMANVVDVLDPQ